MYLKGLKAQKVLGRGGRLPKSLCQDNLSIIILHLHISSFMLPFSLKNKKDLGMTCHLHIEKKLRNKGKCHYPASVPSHPYKINEWDGTAAG